MQTHHDELRDELVAILSAGRELSSETDTQLADAFLHYLERQQEHEPEHAPAVESPHQPHYSLMLAGAAWGAAVMFLFLLLLLDNPNPVGFVLVSVLLLSMIAALTRAFLYLARH